MKTSKILAAIALAVCLPTAASAGPYIGGDYQFTSPFIDPAFIGKQPQHFGAFNLHLGWRQGPVAAELGYVHGGKIVGDGFRVAGPTFDLYGFAPFRASEVFLTAGIQNLRASVTPAPLALPSDWTWRAGAGLQFGNPERFTGRLMLRYEDFSLGKRAAGGITFSAGINIGLGQ